VGAVSYSYNDSSNGVTDAGSVQRVGNIGVGIDQNLIWLLTFSGLLTENGLTASPEATDLVAASVVSEITLPGRCCRAFCDYPRECEQLAGWWRGTGWSAATSAATTPTGHYGE
jgi:hypothetical protein